VALRSPDSSAPAAADEISRLRERMQRLQGGVPRLPLQTHPALAGIVQLQAGGSYQVDGATLAMALMAGPSQAGSWCAVIGVDDFGAEAAVELGIDLSRTALVPEPGDQWLEVTAAMIDVASVVVVRPPTDVAASVAEKLGARLRKRSAALVAWGQWPRCDLRLSVQEPRWAGVGQGHGHLRSRRLVVEAQRGSAPPRRTALWFPAQDASYRRAVAPVEAAEAAEVRSAS
jgi:hypothetical protein